MPYPLDFRFSGAAPGAPYFVVSTLFDPVSGVSGCYRPIKPFDFYNFIYNESTQSYNVLTTADLRANGQVVSGSAIRTSNNVPFPGNIARKELFIQNLSTSPLFVNLTNGNIANPTGFNVILKGGTATDDGLGGTFNDLRVTGVVNCSGQSTRYLIWEAV